MGRSKRKEVPGTAPGRWPSRRCALALATVLVVGAGLRTAYLAELRTDPFFLSPVLDADLHDYWARGLAFGDWKPPADRPDPEIRSTPYFRPPGYPYVLAGVYRLTGGSPAGARAVQLALGLAGAFLGFLVARRYGGSLAGLVCAGLMATSWNLIFFEGELLDASLLATLTPLVLLALRSAGDRGSAWSSAVAGASLGAFALVRPNGLALVPAMALWLGWVRGRRGPRQAAWRSAACLVVGAVVAIAPATIRNRAVSGEWILLSSNGGINLHIGNNPRADGIRAGIPDLEEIAGIGGWTCFEYPLVVEGLSRQVGRPVGYAEASRIFASRARGWIAEHPGRFAALTVKRLGLFLGPDEIGDRDVDLSRASSPVLRRLPGRFPWYLAAAIVGIALASWEDRRRREVEISGEEVRRDRLELGVLFMLFAAVYVATFLPFFFNARYRTPVLVILFVFSGDAVARIASLMRQRLFQTAALAIAAFVGIGAIASLDPSGHRADAGEWHYQRANAYRDAGDAGAAVREYQRAIELSPRSAAPLRDLALVYREQGRVGEAARLLRSALERDPTAYEARFDLGQILAGGGDFAGAVRELEQVVAQAPRHAHAHLSLGTALAQLGRSEEAFRHYAQAEALAPRDPLVAFAIGRALLAQGRRSEGAAYLRRAIELAPDFEAARRALASVGG